MYLPVLVDLLIIFVVAIIVLLICNRFRIPVIVGFLITGVLSGPHGFRLIGTGDDVAMIADLGVVLLLFAIGIELSLKDMLRIKRTLLVGGPAQVIATGVVIGGIAVIGGLDWPEATLVGMMAAMSSTAISMKSYQELGESDSPHARAVVSISIFQDVASVPMLLAIPLLAGQLATSGEIGKLLFFGLGMALFVFVAARWLAPPLLRLVAQVRNRELFLLVVVVIGLGVALLSSAVGLSLALGAFLAGLIISESDYSHYAIGNITPFRDLFVSLFFVSVGMLLDIGVIFGQPILILSLSIGVLLVKTLIVVPILLVLGYPLRTAVMTGVGLSNVGEFAFVLAGGGLATGLLTGSTYQLFLAVSAVTMTAAPFLIRLGPRLAQQSARWRLPVFERFQNRSVAPESESLADHLIIVGYGVNGRNLARASQAVAIPYVILDMNPETVKQAKIAGERVYFGDASHPDVWHLLNVRQARVVTIAISDPQATRSAVAVVRDLNPDVRIITRTRYLSEIETLFQLGADEVIPEEFETSVEIFTRVLRNFLIPEGDIDAIVDAIRADNYDLLRRRERGLPTLALDANIVAARASTIRVDSASEGANRSLAELDLRNRFGVSILVIKRGEQIISNPPAEFIVGADDVLLLYGEEDKIQSAAQVFAATARAAD